MSLQSFSRFVRVLGPWCAVLAIATTALAQTTFLQRLSSPGGTNTHFSVVAVDGSRAAVGAFGETVSGAANAGAVYVFTKSGSTWTQQQRLVASDPTAGREFGRAVAIDGDTVVVGARLSPNPTRYGSVYVFVFNGTSWVQQAKLEASDKVSGTLDGFGSSVAIDGDYIAVGAHLRPPGGFAYVYERSGMSWTERKLTTPPSAPTGSTFGRDVGVSGSTVCVGADGAGGNTQGGVYVFIRGTSAWTMQTEVFGDAGFDLLGTSCAIDGDTMVAGAIGVNSLAGAAYVYQRSGTAWMRQTTLNGSVPAVPALMGESVGVNGDTIVVGAEGAGQNGVAYIFERVGAGPTWIERQALPANDPEPFAFFGRSVAIDAASVFVGAISSNASSSGSTGAGFVNVYARASSPPTGPPGAPTNFTATVSGNDVSCGWGAPTTGAPPTSYTLIARTTGGTLLAAVPLGLVTSFGAAAPNGVYVLSVLASNASGPGPESTSRTVTVPATAPPPGAPTGLTVSVTSGNTATFAWNAPTTGGPATSYLLLAGLVSGFVAPIASVPLPASPTGFAVPAVPPGLYYVRVLAQNSGGMGPPSSEVTVTVAPASSPGAPMLSATPSGSTANLSWTAGGGGAPTSFLLTASLTPGGPVIASLPLTGTSISIPGVPAGTYYLRLLAVNAVGTSPPSNEVVLTVP